MEDDFDKLIQSFDIESHKTEKKMEEIFQQSVAFLEDFKEVLQHGTEQEKIAIRKKMDLLRAKLKEASERSQRQLKLTPEEIKQLSSDPSQFTSQQWQFLQKAQQQLQEEKEKQHTHIQAQKDERKEELKAKAKKKLTTKKSSWMKS